MRAKRLPLKLALIHLVCCALYTASAQDLHMRLTGQTYDDDKISVTAPPAWTIATENADIHSGAILRKGKYILRLCTSCAQTSGITGGRFSEISGMVQPWYRVDPGAKGSPCGQERTTRISEQLTRTDFWFRRDPAHIYNEEADDCRQPKTRATVWYGSYFAANCSFATKEETCGGFFLNLNWLTGHHQREVNPADEMAFALAYDETDLDQMPHQGDPELNRVLTEASDIVSSVHWKTANLGKPKSQGESADTKLQRLTTVLSGKWLLSVRFEPMSGMPTAFTGSGEESWHRVQEASR